MQLHLKYAGRTSGPIFAKDNDDAYKTSSCFRSMAQRIFNKAELPCTPHSIRRAGFQWAGRCGGSVADIKRNARHSSKSCEFMTYMNQGCKKRNDYENGGRDPIASFWVRKVATPDSQPVALDYLI